MTRHITKMLLAASALTVLAAAPAAFAAPVVDTKLSASKPSAEFVKTAQNRDRTSNRTRNRAQRANRNDGNRNRNTRTTVAM